MAAVAVGTASKSLAILVVADAMLPWLGFDNVADDAGALLSIIGELVCVSANWVLRQGDLPIEL